MNNTKNLGIETIVQYISQNKEFEFLEDVSKLYNINFNTLCDFSLRRYAFYQKNNLDSLGAKILSLGEAFDYATACYRVKKIQRINTNIKNKLG